MRRRLAGSRVLVAAAVAVLALSASACGGGKSGTTTEASGSPATEWASGACSAFTEWQNQLQGIQQDLDTQGSVPTVSAVRQAGRDAEKATQTLVKTLKNLGTPSTTGGEQAKSEVDALETSLTDSMSTIQGAVP